MRTFLGLTILVVASTFGDLLLTRTMKSVGEVTGVRPLRALGVVMSAFWRPSMWAALSLQAVAFFSFLALLSWANVSVVVPASALGYAAGALGAKFFLRETLSPVRWTGILLISCGVALVLAG
jgi:drug/metabolite transporter (DMT)-like permease